jgi:hypothetical protein
LCGITKHKIDIISKLLDETPTSAKINLNKANNINSAFLVDQRNYPEHSPLAS